MTSIFNAFRPLFLAILLIPTAVFAQGSNVAFGNVQQDTSKPVEVVADDLAVNQNDGTAIFTGNVEIGQGAMRLTAARVLVVYRENSQKIERMEARGGVTIVSGEDAAEAAEADYNIDSGQILLRGDVLLVQGENAITAQRMTIDTVSGTAQMGGRVKTVLQAGE